LDAHFLSISSQKRSASDRRLSTPEHGVAISTQPGLAWERRVYVEPCEYTVAPRNLWPGGVLRSALPLRSRWQVA